MKKINQILLCSTLVLAACQTDQSSIRPQIDSVTTARPTAPTGIVPANCPPRGLVLRTSHGREFHNLGRDPSDPEVCLWSASGSRRVSRFLHGLEPADDDPQVVQQTRIALRSLFPLAEGKTSQYNVQRSGGFWRITWRVLGQTTIDVPAGRFRTWVLEYIEEGMFGNNFRGERIYFIDTETGEIVRLDSRVVRGLARTWGSFVAISLRRND